VTLPSAPKPPVDPSIIRNAPIGPDLNQDDKVDVLEQAYTEIGYLADELAQTRAELESLQERRTVEQVRARMIEPYANKVFRFVAIYCLAVGGFLIADGIGGGFDLPESTMGIISGSTAVAVIGLIGMVISGLFGGKHQ